MSDLDIDTLRFDKGGGFVTVVTVDAVSGAVLMIARADREALERTMATGEMHYHSRARGPWHKGATSGNVQRVASLSSDCDGDAVLALVNPAGPACHTGTVSCFGDAALAADSLGALDATIARRAGGEPEPPAAADPARPSYTRRLLADRNLRLKKLGEEAAELVVACADGDEARVAEEGADLLYHTLVALRGAGVSLNDVRRVLTRRAARPWTVG
ncbi:MAG TPA: bifunctional phosphoribosyl-AMP cyclohydrolase/phosphoribosyl-ATP diphosphatase HisIE [Gemmatimonadaceae bacterium]|nr:bifunctional phosphoribosyl-AMP cyclohydrolase/phosphoribosyl-ATP diphosphatase HisIE [Gemmatimonadaceae bacterium]